MTIAMSPPPGQGGRLLRSGLLPMVLAVLPAALAADPALPREFRPTPARIAPIPAPEGTAAAWQTAHFRLFADEDLDRETLQGFATTIESVPQLLESFPLPLWSPPSTVRPLVRLCRDQDRFEDFGGPEGSSGFYDGRKAQILIRADLFLSPPRQGQTRLTAPPDEDLLVHELCHLGMHRILAWGRPWLYEGLAEYFAAAHQGKGSYRFTNSPQLVRDHFRRYLARDQNGQIVLPPLAQVLSKTGKQWVTENKENAPEDRYRPYAAALLLVHYHLEGGQERREHLRDHLEALQSYRDPRLPRPVLKTPDPKVIEGQLQKYWSSRGLPLLFTEL